MSKPLIIASKGLSLKPSQMYSKARLETIKANIPESVPIIKKADERKIRSVSFNKTDPIELSLLHHSNLYSNFSSYIKKLIQRDYEVKKGL